MRTRLKINKLRLKQESLIEKKEEARRRLIEKRAFKSEEVDLAYLNKEEVVADIEEVVADISNQIDELEREILTQDEKVAEMEAQLEKERDEIQKDIESLKLILKEDREKFERMIVEVCIASYKMASCIHTFTSLNFFV